MGVPKEDPMSVYQRNGKWWIGYRHVQTGKWTRTVGGPTKAKAQEALAKVWVAVPQILASVSAAEPMVRFVDFVDVYVASAREENKKSWEHEASILRRLCGEF